MKTFLFLIRFHYRIIGRKLFLLFVFMGSAVFFQGLGLSLFLPILQGEDSDSKLARLLKQAFATVGLEYTLLSCLVLLVLFFFIRSGFLMWVDIYVGKVSAYLLARLRCSFTKKIFELDYQASLKKSSGYLNNALVVEMPAAVSSFESLANLINAILFFLLYLGIPLIFNPALVLLLCVVGIPFLLVMRWINTRTKQVSSENSACSAGLQRLLIQALNNFKYLKATAEHPSLLRQIFSKSWTLGNLQVKQKILGTLASRGLEPFVILIVAAIIFYTVEMQSKSIIEQSFFLYLLYNALNRFVFMQTGFRKLLATWGSIQVFQNLERDLEQFTEEALQLKQSRAVDFNRPIRLDHVGFSYQDGTEVLRDINITIEPNSTVAIVGGSGAGKTTLVNLIIYLLRPTSGSLLLGETPYAEIQPERIRKSVGYITQESVIFQDSILNNITLWKGGSPEQQLAAVKAAAKKAHLEDFINGLESGYEALLGESGLNVSGGQRQRIGIARELYKDAKIVIFDEATSSLDSQTEKEIQRNIDEFKGQKTIILVTHRLSTVRNADRIYCLKDGEVAEEGTYEELCSRQGAFRRMVDRQQV